MNYAQAGLVCTARTKYNLVKDNYNITCTC